ncbi:hypothetical protein IAQ61_007123 [Plenodomus lingam]|uniref:uncharacterized protein n=1 Tax=Leptosphaeria maculans TaxID=5022 RepID=UPI003331F4A2|nr:hypothetical protein IAQ61_007123 [Plenodomus lingam]
MTSLQKTNGIGKGKHGPQISSPGCPQKEPQTPPSTQPSGLANRSKIIRAPQIDFGFNAPLEHHHWTPPPITIPSPNSPDTRQHPHYHHAPRGDGARIENYMLIVISRHRAS